MALVVVEVLAVVAVAAVAVALQDHLPGAVHRVERADGINQLHDLNENIRGLPPYRD